MICGPFCINCILKCKNLWNVIVQSHEIVWVLNTLYMFEGKVRKNKGKGRENV